MGLVKAINDEKHFKDELELAQDRLVVVDFTAVWCGPCRKIAPIFEEYSVKYSNVVFLKVDVNKCNTIALNNNVRSMPTFIFFRNTNRISTISGADPQALEDEIIKLSGNAIDNNEDGSGFIDLKRFIMKSGTECLNENDDHCLSKCLFDEVDYLESDCDEQLIISIAFTQPMKTHSLKIQGSKNNGPKNIRLFINQPKTLDFDQAESITSTQDIKLTEENLNGEPIELRFVKFQNVQNLQIFVKDNQSGSDKTIIEKLIIYGLPISATNMNEFKRISGKKGESH